MRAKEFVQRQLGANKTINISITIPDGDEDPAVQMLPHNQQADMGASAVQPAPAEEPGPQDMKDLPSDQDGDPDTPVMVPPLQQEIEIRKADVGKDSKVISQLTHDENGEGEEEQEVPLSYRAQ